MKEYRCQGLRRVKTDKQDAIAISHYGIDHWYRLKEYEAQENIYTELKLLGRQYCHYMRMRVESVLELTHLLANACGKRFGTDPSSGLYDAGD